jgi:Protein of unknown function (DUF3768)
MTETATASKIAQLNDRFRKGDRKLGIERTTEMVEALSSEQQQELFRLVRTFDQFTEENDPHEEHDFAIVELDAENYFFKIDYYAPDMEHGSEDPSDPTVTRRVMTIMHSSEY